MKNNIIWKNYANLAHNFIYENMRDLSIYKKNDCKEESYLIFLKCKKSYNIEEHINFLNYYIKSLKKHFYNLLKKENIVKYKNNGYKYSKIEYYEVDLNKVESGKNIVGKINITYKSDSLIYNPLSYTNTIIASSPNFKNKIIEIDNYGGYVNKNSILHYLDNYNKMIVDKNLYLSNDLKINLNGKIYNSRIRELSTFECYRLMGLKNKDIKNLHFEGILPNNQHYKLAGNSIVINCLKKVFSKMKLPKKIKMLELFAGYGSQKKALKELGFIVESDISEWFTSAIITYSLIHKFNEFYEIFMVTKKSQVENFWSNNKKVFSTNGDYPSNINLKGTPYKIKKATFISNKINNNLGSILDIKKLEKKYDLITYSFPCQSISQQGKNKSFENNKTRSGLVWEVIRLLKQAKKDNILPKYLLMENVKSILNKKHINNFNLLKKELELIGYENYVEMINALDCGIPQKRERVFMISKLKNKENYND